MSQEQTSRNIWSKRKGAPHSYMYLVLRPPRVCVECWKLGQCMRKKLRGIAIVGFPVPSLSSVRQWWQLVYVQYVWKSEIHSAVYNINNVWRMSWVCVMLNRALCTYIIIYNSRFIQSMSGSVSVLGFKCRLLNMVSVWVTHANTVTGIYSISIDKDLGTYNASWYMHVCLIGLWFINVWLICDYVIHSLLSFWLRSAMPTRSVYCWSNPFLWLDVVVVYQ